MAGLFEDFEVDFESEVEEFGQGLPVGPYEVIVSQVTTEDKDSGKYLVITYTVTDGPKKGQTHREYQRMILGRPQNDGEINALRAIKTRMLSFGVPENRINTVSTDDLVGIEGVITLTAQKNSSYTRTRFDLVDDSNAVPALPAGKRPEKSEQADKDDPFA